MQLFHLVQHIMFMVKADFVMNTEEEFGFFETM